MATRNHWSATRLPTAFIQHVVNLKALPVAIDAGD
jgi:hypothetical protein